MPAGLSEVFGESQWGTHLDVIVPLWRPSIEGYDNAVLSLALRAEHVDYNRGRFSSTGQNIGDEVTAVVSGLSFRPTAGSVLRANYRFHWIRDFAGNPRAHLAGFQLGIATYF